MNLLIDKIYEEATRYSKEDKIEYYQMLMDIAVDDFKSKNELILEFDKILEKFKIEMSDSENEEDFINQILEVSTKEMLPDIIWNLEVVKSTTLEIENILIQFYCSIKNIIIPEKKLKSRKRSIDLEFTIPNYEIIRDQLGIPENPINNVIRRLRKTLRTEIDLSLTDIALICCLNKISIPKNDIDKEKEILNQYNHDSTSNLYEKLSRYRTSEKRTNVNNISDNQILNLISKYKKILVFLNPIGYETATREIKVIETKLGL